MDGLQNTATITASTDKNFGISLFANQASDQMPPMASMGVFFNSHLPHGKQRALLCRWIPILICDLMRKKRSKQRHSKHLCQALPHGQTAENKLFLNPEANVRDDDTHEHIQRNHREHRQIMINQHHDARPDPNSGNNACSRRIFYVDK